MWDTSNLNLFIHNVTYFGGAILNIVLVCVVLYIRRAKLDTLVVTFVLMTLSVVIFQVSQVLGVNAATADISRRIFMLNLAVIPIQIFMTHWFLALMGKVQEKKTALTVVYASGIILLLIHILFPQTYLLNSVPKLYLPFYYVAGNLQWLTRVWFHFVGAYYFWILLRAYQKSIDPIIKNRYLFVLLAVLYGFIVGESAVFLVYNIPFDPMWSSFFSVYTFLIAYAILRYQLLDVRFIIQRAFVYAVSVSFLIGFLIFVNSSSDFVKAFFPSISSWVVPAVSSLIVVVLGISMWSKLHENDHIKYEFITVIAHKFRTPLTQTRWAAEELMKTNIDPEQKNNVSYIQQSNEKLVNLMGTLIELTETNTDLTDLYHFETTPLSPLLKTLLESFRGAFDKKKLHLVTDVNNEQIFVHADKTKLIFAIQTLIENSIAYTPDEGTINISLVRNGGKAKISVADTGIGIGNEDIRNIFSKFYRADQAKAKDTEGLGVGLFLAQSIVKRHNGKIYAHSQGIGKGSEFTLLLPLV
jgi:signal transduction histidine kinase